jgi:hypothetical protein
MRTSETASAYEQQEEWSQNPAEEVEEWCASEVLTDDQARERSEVFHRLVIALEAQLDQEGGGGELDVEAFRSSLTDEELEGVRLFDLAAKGVVNGKALLAEDRLEQLGDALALLQPLLAIGLHDVGEQARDDFQELCERIDLLHEELVSLEDAQAEMFAQDREAEAAADQTDEDENTDEATEDERVEPAASSLFEGDEVDVEPRAPSTVYDPTGD